MRKNQKGFSAVEALLVLVIIGLLGLVGWYVYSNRQTSKMAAGNGNSQKSLAYKSEHYSLNLSRSVNNDFVGSYSLVVSFNDSFDPDAQCPVVQNDFKSSIVASDVKDNSAVLTITQNKKPYKKSSEMSGGACPAVVVPAHEDKYSFDKAWLENTSPAKTLTIQGKKYTLQSDKQTYKLTLTNGSKSSTAAYIPDGIGALYTYPACKTLDELETYAKDNDIELAEAKYPGIEQKLQELGGSEHNTNQYNQSLLVITNDFLKNLLKQKGTGTTCKVWASNTPVSASLGSDIMIE